MTNSEIQKMILDRTLENLNNCPEILELDNILKANSFFSKISKGEIVPSQAQIKKVFSFFEQFGGMSEDAVVKMNKRIEELEIITNEYYASERKRLSL